MYTGPPSAILRLISNPLYPLLQQPHHYQMHIKHFFFFFNVTIFSAPAAKKKDTKAKINMKEAGEKENNDFRKSLMLQRKTNLRGPLT